MVKKRGVRKVMADRRAARRLGYVSLEREYYL